MVNAQECGETEFCRWSRGEKPPTFFLIRIEKIGLAQLGDLGKFGRHRSRLTIQTSRLPGQVKDRISRGLMGAVTVRQLSPALEDNEKVWQQASL